MPPDSTPLDGWLVADLSTGIAGAYCTKILADGGAEVVKIEPPEGDSLRSWSASGASIRDGDDGALFKFLAQSKRGVVADPESVADLASVAEILSVADAVIWSRGSRLTDLAHLSPSEILREYPQLTVTSITNFGLEGPWKDRPATEFTLQAWSGGIIGLARGEPDRAPAFVGGQVGLWLAGAYAAVGTLASRSRNDGAGELVDVSILEALALCLTYYPVTYFESLGRPFRSRRSVVTPGVGLAKDGLIAVGVGTGQQWLDFCVMVGHSEWMEDKTLFRERGHLAPAIDEWFSGHTVAEISDLASGFRLPFAPVHSGSDLPHFGQFEARESFIPSPDGSFVQPRPPYRMQPARLRSPERAPRLGQDTGFRAGRQAPAIGSRASTELPFTGLRVLDMTAFWAGPSCTHPLAMLGAEVIHLESIGRLDGTRMLGPGFDTGQWWERSPIFSGLNTNKKSLTLDFQSEKGMEVLRRLIATSDVVVENYTPRVLDQAGLTFEGLRAIRGDVIVIRMPGFGLDGPWRDNAAFAYTIEDVSGLTWMTGYADQKPLEPYCVGDPNAGVHALAGLLLALEHRRKTGEGVSVEAAMCEAAVNITAEQVIEYSAYGALLERAGNGGPAAWLQNLYRTSDLDERGGSDSWVAVAVTTDDEREALLEALGRSGRSDSPDVIDQELTQWCGARRADDVVEALWTAGVPVARVMQPHRQGDLPQLQARGFFEVVDHPVAGSVKHSTLPMRFSSGPDRLHTRHAPLLGEHNAELLAELGYDHTDIAALELEGIIGRSPIGS